MNDAQKSANKGCVWLSVIIPVYNTEKYLETCIESVLSQSFNDYEIILVDDGSTDSSPLICKTYEESSERIRYYRKNNGGPLSTRVFGVERARGEYVCFLDSDDYWVNGRVLERLYRKNKFYHADVVQFCLKKKYNHLTREIVNIEKEEYAQRQEFLQKDYPLLLCSFWDVSRLTTSTCNKIYRRSLFESVPDSNSMDRVFWGDDLILNLIVLSRCQSALFIPDVYYVYRQFSGGTSRFSRTEMKDLDTIKKYQLSYLKTYEEENRETIRSILFSETAGWFLAYVKKCASILTREEFRQMVEETLNYKTFIAAQEYYRENKIQWKPGKLLAEGDWMAYLSESETTPNERLKEKIRSILKEIYYRI